MTSRELMLLLKAYRLLVTDGDYDQNGNVKNTWEDGVFCLQRLIRFAKRKQSKRKSKESY